MTEIYLTSIDGGLRLPAYQIGPYGSWSDLQPTFRWGDGACGMYEAGWTMPLPPDFEHPLLRRGTLVELADAPWRIGSPLVLSEPGRGSGLSNPWTLQATGVGREVEGESSWYCDDGTGDTTTIASLAIDTAITNGLPWAGRDVTIPTVAWGDNPSEGLQTIAALLNSFGDVTNQRWGVWRDGVVGYRADPTTPTYQIVPGVVSLGTADDDYASVVKLRYADSGTGANRTATAPATPSAVETRYGRREYPVDVTSLGPVTSVVAQSWAEAILAKSKGRLAWTNSLTVTSDEILTMGGVPADLSKVAEDVGEGCMVRLHGVWSDLLESTGNPFLDIIIGEAKPSTDGLSIDLAPLGLAPRDLASVVESITGLAAAA